jgi:hypothetical protein
VSDPWSDVLVWSCAIPRYAIPFQKDLASRDFMACYDSEGQCIKAVCKTRWPNGFECPPADPTGVAVSPRACSIARTAGSRPAHCRTRVPSTKSPLIVWFQAVHLLAQDEQSVSALKLKRQLSVHDGTPWVIKDKLMQVMLERETQTTFSGRIEVNGVYMNETQQQGAAGPGCPR